MTAKEVKKGMKVKYHPIIGVGPGEDATVTSDVFEIGGTPCCKIDIRSGCVAVEALEYGEDEEKVG